MNKLKQQIEYAKFFGVEQVYIDLKYAKQLLEKETPVKVREIEETDKFVGKIITYKCPKCEHELFHKFIDINRVTKYKSNYCEVCGQKLDWKLEE